MSDIERRAAAVSRIDFTKVPEALGAIINVEDWASSLLRGTPYTEPNPEYISRLITLRTLTAQSIEEVFAQQGVKGLQETVADTPGATTGAIEITDLYVAESDYQTGQPCFIVISATDLETGEEWRRTTGATNVQATILALLVNGMWPIRCQIKRGDSKDKGGHYLFFVVPPD